MNLGNQIQLYSKNEINRLMCHKFMGTSVSDWSSGDCPKKYFCVCTVLTKIIPLGGMVVLRSVR